jgi:ABC-type protease/lipase transport system fused ATPase/permease subunit
MKNPVATFLHRNRSFESVRKHRWLKFVVSVGAVSFLRNATTLGIPLVILRNYESVRQSQDIRFFLILFGVVAAIHIVQGLLRLIRLRLLRRFAAAFADSYRYSVVAAAFDATCSTKAAAKRMLDIDRIIKSITGDGLVIFFDVPWVLLFIIVLSSIDIWLGIVSLAFALTTAAIAAIEQGQRRKLPAGGEEYGFSKQAISAGDSAHRAFFSRPRFIKMCLEQNHEAARSRQTALRLPDFLKMLARTVKAIQGVVLLGLAAYLTVQSHAAVGIMMVAAFLAPRVSEPVETLVRNWSEIAESRKAWARLKKIKRARPRETSSGPSALSKETTLAAKLLSVGRSNSDSAMVSDVSFSLAAGGILTIEGCTGSGKTALANALAGCSLPLSGSIVANGIDQLELADEERLSSIGYLPQDIQFYRGNLADNISRFSRGLDSNLLAEACHQIGLSRFIAADNGSETDFEDAVRFPGIRQRVAIARAIYGSPRILILDEPTVHLDREGLARFEQILISHREAGGISVILTADADAISVTSQTAAISGGRLVFHEPIMVRLHRQTVGAG